MRAIRSCPIPCVFVLAVGSMHARAEDFYSLLALPLLPTAGLVWLTVHEEQRARAAEARAALPRQPGAQCQSDKDCIGSCNQGICVGAQKYLAPSNQSAPECQEDESCAAGLVCRRFRCVPPKLPAIAPSDSEESPPTPASPPEGNRVLQRERLVADVAFEQLIKQRPAQLREELALGRGALLSTIARARGFDARLLGVTTREHRRVLAETIDGADPTWPRNFFARLDAVMKPGVASR